MPDAFADLLETSEFTQVATGFGFTEGRLASGRLPVLRRYAGVSGCTGSDPGQAAEVARADSGETNGTTFDMQGRLVMCEGGGRQITRMNADGPIEVLADRFEGGRLNRPNDLVCRSDGSIFFTDPSLRVPFAEREVPNAGVYRIAPDGALSLVADCEYPNGLAFSPDERILYVANSRWSKYVHALEINDDGTLRRRRIFADMNSDEPDGVPDGMKVDVEGRVYCTGPGGVWVFTPYGAHLGIIRPPELPANLAFGGPDGKTLFFTARTSVYSVRVKVPGQPHPWVAKK